MWHAPAIFGAFASGLLLSGLPLFEAAGWFAVATALLFLARIPSERQVRLLLLAFVASGWLTGHSDLERRVSKGVAIAVEGGVVEGWAVVRTFPRIGPYGASVIADLSAVQSDGRWEHARAGVRLMFAETDHPQRGETIHFRTRLRPVRNLGIAGEYDRVKSESTQGVFYAGRPKRYEWQKVGDASAFDRSLSRIRERILTAADLNLTEETGGLWAALVLGERQRIPRYLQDAFRDAGVTHLIAISGLHLSIIFLLLRWIIGRLLSLSESLLLRVNVNWWSSALALPGVSIYTYISGAHPPTLRALLMLCVVVFAGAFGKRAGGMQTLCLAGLMLLAGDPALLHSVSFQLSFTAVFAAIAWNRKMEGAEEEQSRLYRMRMYLLASLYGSFVATLWTMPLTTYHFGQTSLIGLVANLPLIPWVSFLLTPAAFFLGCVVAVWPEGPWPWMLWEWLASITNALTLFFAGVPGARLDLKLDGTESIAVVTALGSVTVFIGVRSRLWRRRAVLVFAGVLLAFVAYEWKRGGQWDGALRVDVLSVGQGDAVLLTSEGGHILVDTGGYPRWGDRSDDAEEPDDIYQRVLRPFFLAKRIHRLDKLVLTHPHQDHVGGAVSLLHDMPVDALVVSSVDHFRRVRPDVLEAAAAMGVPVTVWTGGERREWRAVQLQVHHPSAAFRAAFPMERVNWNEISLAFDVRTGDGACILLTGDAESGAEAAMLKENTLKNCGLFKAGHHGSRTSSGDALLERVQPSHALVSRGFANRYGHPHPEAMGRFRERGIGVFDTAELGSLTLRASEGHWTLEAGRMEPLRLEGPPASPLVNFPP